MKEYWWCAIGPVDRKTLPWGADFPLRQAVRTAMAEMVGQDVENNLTTSSGWGMDQEERDEIRKVQYRHFFEEN